MKCFVTTEREKSRDFSDGLKMDDSWYWREARNRDISVVRSMHLVCTCWKIFARFED